MQWSELEHRGRWRRRRGIMRKATQSKKAKQVKQRGSGDNRKPNKGWVFFQLGVLKDIQKRKECER